MLRRAGIVAASLALLGSLAAAREARACGGCFARTETEQVVTDHRMVMAVHANESILWDQIEYTGDPSEFSWVLPVWGDVQVEIAAPEFFDELAARTAVTVRSPQVVAGCLGADSGGGCGASAAGAHGYPSPSESGQDTVQVVHEATVGPYETVTLRSTDANALANWLRDHQYTVPASVEPVLQFYNDRHMDFVALRLVPGAGVQAMQPVRIRYATANMVLPLRMVAAGVGDKVGISLWVFGAGRFESANFANGQVAAGELVWNWDTNRSNYQDVFASTLTRLGGRGWITEYADASNTLASNSGPLPSAAQADWSLAVGDSPSTAWVTALRTDLLAQYLDSDLQLQPSGQSAPVSNRLQAVLQSGTAPGSRCSAVLTVATPADAVRHPRAVVPGVVAGVLALLVARRVRRGK